MFDCRFRKRTAEQRLVFHIAFRERRRSERARYIAAELGTKEIRVHPVSPGPIKTRAVTGIDRFDELTEKAARRAPTCSLVTIEDVGVATAFLASDYAMLITADTMYVDGGYHVIGV